VFKTSVAECEDTILINFQAGEENYVATKVLSEGKSRTLRQQYLKLVALN
jgi:hypothetical protein